MPTRVLIPSGVLGLGFSDDALHQAMEQKPDIISIDGGSTDSGPFYLGSGTSKYAADICRAEWRKLMRARAGANIPLVIGSCGTCGTDAMVDWMYALTREIAAELGQQVKIARLYSSRKPGEISTALNAGRVTPLPAAPGLDEERIAAMTNIVALAGAEQIGMAIKSGADIILAGRATDTATISALPLMRGEHVGASWHGAKIGECGAFCSTNPGSGVIMITFDKTGFTTEPMATDARCTPHSVSAHMLYENADPFILHEPGGYLDVSAATYKALDERKVRVEGSRWIEAAQYSVKLEGALLTGYQTSLLAIIRDTRYVANAEIWAERLLAFCHEKIANDSTFAPDDYSLEMRLIGINAALGPLETKKGNPVEIGLLMMITAPNQEAATELSKLINPFLLHFPLTAEEETPTFAFPYSPAHSERGALYEFGLNHILALNHPMDGFSLLIDEVGDGKS